jgi:electron transfer DM13
MSKRNALIVLGVIVLGGLWFAFRPERLFVNQAVNESFPATNAAASSTMPAVLAAGQFHNGAHDTMGTATIYQTQQGGRILRLTNFKTSNGPDVHVYLVAANDATDSDTVKRVGFIQLGPIKGNEGDQNYDVPATADLSKYRAVTIWCERFSVNFGTAPLQQSAMTSNASGGTPEPAAAEVLGGKFHSGAHETSGMAAIYQLPAGGRVLRLTNFKTSNGPDVHVYLVAANDATDNDTVKKAGFIELGALKGNEGDQNYDVPLSADLSKYRAVTIWCRRFSVNFGTAPLTQSESRDSNGLPPGIGPRQASSN